MVNGNFLRGNVKTVSSYSSVHWLWIRGTFCLIKSSNNFLRRRIPSFKSPPFKSGLIVVFPTRSAAENSYATFVKLFVNWSIRGTTLLNISSPSPF